MATETQLLKQNLKDQRKLYLTKRINQKMNIYNIF